jgi:excinuclease UvrABC nuclease subunit
MTPAEGEAAKPKRTTIRSRNGRLVIIDGGRSQLNAVREVFAGL